MKIADFSVKNSLFVNLLSFLILAAGIFNIFSLRKEAFPPVSFDVVIVTTSFRGASADKVEKLVTTPIENELKTVDDIDEITSSSDEGSSVITLKLISGADMRKTINDIQKAVDRVTSLPEDVTDRPTVMEITSGQIPVIQVAISGNVDEFILRHNADRLKDMFEDINGVSSVSRSGWRNEQFTIEPDINKMRDYHLSFKDIADAIKAQNVDAPGGKFEVSGKETLVKISNELKTGIDIQNTVIRANDMGNWLTIKDIAQVRHGFEDETITNRARGGRAIILTVIKRKNGDILKIVDNVHAILAHYKKDTPPEIKISSFNDMSYYVRRRLNVLSSNGLFGFIFVVIILFMFLPPACAFLTALGIPIAMCTTFWMMGAFGISINLITMFGLITVLGMVVDDGIIISENVYRYMEKGMSPKDAAIAGTNEVMLPVVTTVLTTIAAFSPLMMMSGLLGRFVRYIPIIVIIALCASLLEAFVVLPSHLSDFVKIKPGKALHKNMPFFETVLAGYRKLLTQAISHRYKVVAAVCIILITTLAAAKFFMPFQLFSSKGVEKFSIRLEADNDASLDTTTEFIKPVEKYVESMPARYVEAYETIIGEISEDRGYDPNSKRGSNLAFINVYLTPSNGRKKTADEIMELYRPGLEKIFESLKPKGVNILAFQDFKDGPPVGKALDIRIRGEHYETLVVISEEIKNYLSALKGVRNINDSYNLGPEELYLEIDEKAAQKAFLTNNNIAFAVRSAFSGSIASTIKQNKAEKEIHILVRLPEHIRNSADILDTILVANRYGDLIHLNQVIKTSKRRSLRTIKHIDGKRFISVTADVDNKKLTSITANDLVQKKFNDIPQRYNGYSLKFSGENKETQESMSSLIRAFAIAFFLIFLILATQFQSLSQPFIVMLTIPFGLIGFIIAFVVHGEPLSFLGVLGFVGLTGVVVNDAIVLVDFINRRRKEIPTWDAVIEAGALRLRPVLLTTLTTVSGLFTVVYGIGGFDPFLKPMALAISWGLLFATGLTLLVIPCVYLIIEDLKIQLCPWAIKKNSTEMPVA